MRNNKKEPVNINNDSNQNVATDETISNLFFTNVSEEAEDNTTNVKSEDKTTDIKVETSIEDNGNNKTNAQIDKVEDNSTDVKPEAPIEDKVTDVKPEAPVEDKVTDAKTDASIEDNGNNDTNDNVSNKIDNNINERRNLAPKPAKTRKPIFPVVIACLILAVVVGGIAYILNNGKSSKKDSLANKPSLFEGLFDFTSPVDSAIGSSELIANYNKCGSLSSTITVDNIYADTDISGATLNATFNHNTASKQASLDADISYRGMKLYSLLSFSMIRR